MLFLARSLLIVQSETKFNKTNPKQKLGVFMFS